ncbi:MAG TPA: hypothetical protein VN611_07965 [Patescibacteria group bacterium]|nr:hypothetical protein [Patescibacteria group bacterium]
MWNERKKPEGSRGFILIDLMVAVLLVVTVVMSISALYLQGNRMAGRSERLTVATFLAQERLEVLKKQPARFWHNLSLPTELLPPTQTDLYEVTVDADVDTDDPQLVRATARVQWMEGSKAQWLQLEALYSRIP